MTESEYQQWWQYHSRVVRGEALNDMELTCYHAGLKKLDQEEAEELQLASLDSLRRQRSHIQLLTQNLAQLITRSEQLNQHIESLEKIYQQLTGYSLLVDMHGTPKA